MGRTNTRKSRLVWKHNSFLGHVARAKQNMQSIGLSETATPEAKDAARKIYHDLNALQILLKERVDANP